MPKSKKPKKRARRDIPQVAAKPKAAKATLTSESAAFRDTLNVAHELIINDPGFKKLGKGMLTGPVSTWPAASRRRARRTLLKGVSNSAPVFTPAEARRARALHGTVSKTGITEAMDATHGQLLPAHPFHDELL